MWDCFTLSLLVALCAACLSHEARTTGGVEDLREDLFLPGIKAQHFRRHGQLREPFDDNVKGEQTPQERQDLPATAPEVDEKVPGPGFSGLLKSSGDGKFEPRHEAWTYCAAFGVAGLLMLLLVAYNVRRGRSRSSDNEEEVCLYSRLQGNGINGRDSSPRRDDSSDLDAERLVLQPLLEQAVLGTARHGRECARSMRRGTCTDSGNRPALKSLWSRIVRSSRELFVPEQFASGSTMKAMGVPLAAANHATTVSTLPTVTSRVESLQEMTEVEKTLWWRTM
ncbi:hypothetical protein V5799_006114 [Amblyomma americanum]|uniref:Transmembrane protein n=1 Tax=Amblyomma americanum TaxID=6943 RepID=A0AAQ4DXB4_AMBAM